MNNAGLPGTGLGGLFYVLLALWMPVAELHATLHGRSSRARWRLVGAQLALACGIVATVVVYLHLVSTPSALGLHGPSLAFAPVVLGAVLLSVLVATLRLWARVQGTVPVAPVVPNRSTARERELAPAGRGDGAHS
jgi:hypothetical protein